MLLRNLLAARAIAVFCEPARFKRLETAVWISVRSITRADDVVNEIALIVDQHLLRCNRLGRVTRHDVIVVEPDDLAGATQVLSRLSVP